jgi:hypothetical protein
MFTPEISVAALRAMKDKYGDRIYGKFGFVDAFNPNMSWVDREVIGINAGIVLLSAENLRTENVWSWFMQNAEIPRAMQRIGLLLYRKPREKQDKVVSDSWDLESVFVQRRNNSRQTCDKSTDQTGNNRR